MTIRELLATRAKAPKVTLAEVLRLREMVRREVAKHSRPEGGVPGR